LERTFISKKHTGTKHESVEAGREAGKHFHAGETMKLTTRKGIISAARRQQHNRGEGRLSVETGQKWGKFVKKKNLRKSSGWESISKSQNKGGREGNKKKDKIKNKTN